MSDQGSSPLIAGVWRASSLAARQAVCPSGHPALDAELPGGGWPLGAMTELLQTQATQHIWQLLAPALGHQMRALGGPVVLVGPPADPFGPGLAARGLDPQQLLCVQADGAAERLWVAEQALRCGEVAGVLLWLPTWQGGMPTWQGGMPPPAQRSGQRPGQRTQGMPRTLARAGLQFALRRLQQAMHPQALFFVARPLTAHPEPSGARLRLALEDTSQCAVRILKRQGPPPLRPVQLPLHPPRLAAVLQGRPVPVPAPVPTSTSTSASTPLRTLRPIPSAEFHHAPAAALDRVVAA